tara:strand:+ start:66 stop:233 length:168 start_codon:yes stop_codon:yes gene_type:complete
MIRLFVNFFAVIGFLNTMALLIFFGSKYFKFKKKKHDNNVQSDIEKQTTTVEKND